MINFIYNSNITEYDIASAGTTTIRFIKGDEFYNKLLTDYPNKVDRNIFIGKMMLTDKTLYKKQETGNMLNIKNKEE